MSNEQLTGELQVVSSVIVESSNSRLGQQYA